MSHHEQDRLPVKREPTKEEIERRSLELKDEVRENIQTLHGFLMVLAIGNAVRELAVSHSAFFTANPSQILPNITYEGAASFAIGLILIFRFFLGDRLFIKSYNPENLVLFVIDMLNIFISAVLIAYLSFFVTHPSYMLFLATILFSLEIAWWLLRSAVSLIFRAFDGRPNNISDDEKVGIKVANIITIATLIAIYVRSQIVGLEIGYNPLEWPAEFSPLFVTAELGWLLTIFLANTVADLSLKGPGYFGWPQDWFISIGRKYTK
ncbi:hypothetical protein FHY55_12220 [Oceanicola sp. D3]|uniref:hypothetical protein n=1 Tax=Oceanicola sp. D3 TaxID=2587163 RepID=UPI00111CE3F8|nr:hypothetical protein [Oceanicola sp. D3]QDC09960.1 hypothetical protein FHY55_12220 [Oceanicola sp. D3]